MTTNLQELRQVESANVFKGERLAATLKRTSAGIVFEYEQSYLTPRDSSADLSPPAYPVATTLPIEAKPVVTVAGAVPPFFAGLLPEGRRLSALREAAKTSMDDELTLLLAVGADPIGDVRVAPAGPTSATSNPPPLPSPAIKWSSATQIVFREVLDDIGVLERRGIAGIQDKASAAMITLPATASGREAIMKFSPPEFAFLVENEAWFLGLAKKVGFLVPKFEVVSDSIGDKALLIERFDRKALDGATVRYAVEDASQVLGLYPAEKYRVTTEQVAQGLIANCAAQRVAARELFRFLLFAWLTGNGDVHAKNLSIIRRDDEWRVAPVYDIPSTLLYGDETASLSMSGRNNDFSRKAFLQFAQVIDLPESAADRAIDDMLIATEPVMQLLDEQVEPFTRGRNAEARAQILHRRRLLGAAD